MVSKNIMFINSKLNKYCFNVIRLSQSKQNKVYFPEEPFPHAQLVKSGRLKHFKHVYTDDLWNDLRQVIENKPFQVTLSSCNHVLIFFKSLVWYFAVILVCDLVMLYILWNIGVQILRTQ